MATFRNPFKPGAGHMPPYLAGRRDETEEFSHLLEQEVILENLVLTGLRGLGKTVLLETFKPMAIQSGWLWAGTDLSESTSISEENLAIRLLTDLSVVTSSMVIHSHERSSVGFIAASETVEVTLDYDGLLGLFQRAPGLISDKLKSVLEAVWPFVRSAGKRGIVFAYDEAQNLSDHATKDQYPLSLLLDCFQSLQRKNINFMLALTGLPTLFPKLVEARTYAERMFHVVFLKPLSSDDTTQAIRRPIGDSGCPLSLSDETINLIHDITKGYPYFVQYICREAFDVWVQAAEADEETPLPSIPVNEIIRKLDADFFAGRWARVTDRQRELLFIISNLENREGEFSVQEVIEHPENGALTRSFSSSHVNQMLGALSESGLIYKNRHGKYSFAVPLMAGFIRRQLPRR
jgi:hypothetical protein